MNVKCSFVCQLCLFILCSWSASVFAATITVDTLDDDGITNDGDCSLREAIFAANLNIEIDNCAAGSAVSGDTIEFLPSIFPPPFGIGFINTTTVLPITDPDLTINGPLSGSLTITGSGTDRVMRVDQSSNGQLTLRRLAIFGGTTSGDGAGLLIQGDTQQLTLEDVTFASNEADGSGGGIGFDSDDSRTLTLNEVAFTGNEAGVDGGAIGGILTADTAINIADSLFQSNTSVGVGGAIGLVPDSGTMNVGIILTVDNSTFFNNGAGASGGAIRLSPSNQGANSASLVVTNSSFRENHAMGSSGGGISVTGRSSGGVQVTILRSSFIENFSALNGGGINISLANPMTVINNLFALNEGDQTVGGASLGQGSLAVAGTMNVIANSFHRNIAGAGTGNAADQAMRATFPGQPGSNYRYLGNLYDSDVTGPGDRPCSFGGGGVGVTATEGFNIIRDNTNAASCVNSADDLIVDEIQTSYEELTGNIHSHALRLLPSSPAIDFWPEAFCVDNNGADLADDMLGPRRMGGVPRDGDNTPPADCDAGSIEAPEGNLLSVARTGSGDGSISSTPAGIDCGTQCEAVFFADSSVTLTPTAEPGSVFTGWSGDCNGDGVCIVAMNTDRTVTAQFELSGFELEVVVRGDGSVTSNPVGINCPGDCDELYPDGEMVTLTAVPGPGQQFLNWTGDCSGPVCQVVMDQARRVTAIFAGPDVLVIDGFE